MIKELVLFGVTGDLAKQKLIPAIFNLYIKGTISKKSSFIGFGRKKFSKIDFQNYIEELVLKYRKSSQDTDSEYITIRDFASQWTYIESELHNPAGYTKLNTILTTNSSVVYLSLPPVYQYEVLQMLIKNSVVSKKNDRKIAIEKPYGFDMDSSKKIEDFLIRKLRNNQILRVDHYAGKQALVELEQVAHQPIFEYIYNSRRIHKIQINCMESINVSTRGAFYDDVGALNDVGQNHMLHMLATILSLPEVAKSKKKISEIRGEALSCVQVIDGMQKAQKLLAPVLAQYESFKSTEGVKSGSTTETFFRAHAYIKKGKNVIGERWGGLHIELVGGKALAKADASIVLHSSNNKEKPIIIAVNGYGTRDAYEQIFTDAFYYNPDRFIDFPQIIKGWEIVEKIKKLAKRNYSKYKVKSPILVYKDGAYPQDISYK